MRVGSGLQSGSGRKLGMDLPEVLSLSLPTSPPPPPPQCGEEELRDLYLSPPSGSAAPCMPPPPGYSGRTPAGGLRASLPVEKPCPLQARREHHGAVELQHHRSEESLRPGQKWTNYNSALYNNSLG